MELFYLIINVIIYKANKSILTYSHYKPGEKFEFSLLMHEINVLTN